jgi:hypothetical protein
VLSLVVTPRCRHAAQTTLDDAITPTVARKKLQGAVPVGAKVVLYKTAEEFNAAFKGNEALEWMEHELRSLSESARDNTTAVQKSAVLQAK